MKKNGLNILLIIIVVLLMLGLLAYYLYDVIVLETPYTDNLLRTLLVCVALLGTLIKLTGGGSRKALVIYEKAYEKELGPAFENKPLLRKKLLCACRLYNESNYRKALKYLFQLLGECEGRRDIVPVLLFMALCYTDAGVPGEAIKVYEDLLKHDPCNTQVHSNLGSLYVQNGKNELALQHYNRAIDYGRDNYFAYINRANYYFRIKEYENAIADAKKALEIKNNGKEAASLLTIIYALNQDEDNKEKYYHIAITSGKKPEDLNAAIAYYMNEVEEESDIWF